MKFFIIASAIFVAALAAHDHEDIHKKCQDDPASHIDNMISGDPSKNENLPANYGKHILCMCKGFNLVTEDGKANREQIQSRVEHEVPHDAAKVAAIVAECSEDKANDEDTAKHIWTCLHKNHIMKGHKHSSEESNESDSNEHQHHHHH